MCSPAQARAAAIRPGVSEKATGGAARTIEPNSGVLDLERQTGCRASGIEAGGGRLALHVGFDTSDVGRASDRFPLGGRLLLEAGAERRDQRLVVGGPGSPVAKPVVHGQLGKSEGAARGLRTPSVTARTGTPSLRPRGRPGRARSVPQVLAVADRYGRLALVRAEVVGVAPDVAADHRRAQELALTGAALVVDAESDGGQHFECGVRVAVDDLVEPGLHDELQFHHAHALALSGVGPVADLATEAARRRPGPPGRTEARLAYGPSVP